MKTCCNLEHICASTVPIFANLNHKELMELNRLLVKVDYGKGDILFSKGESAQHLYILRYGRIKIYDVSPEGKQQIVRILEQGDFLGELSLFRTYPQPFFAEAMEDSGLCLLYRQDLKDLIKANPEISLQVLESISERLALTETFITDLTLKSVEERLSTWLMMMAQHSGVHTPEGIKISINLSRQELAQLLGTTPETISRRLTRLQESGAIKLQGQRTIIVDKERLEALGL